jgi:hypothetical protein
MKMKKKVFGWITVILGIIDLISTVIFEIHVWDYNKWDIFRNDFKIWALLVLMWVTFGYFFIRWSCEEFLDRKYSKKNKSK